MASVKKKASGKCELNKLQVKFYPNSGQSKIMIKSSNERGELTLSITDVTGRIITQQKIKTQILVLN